MFQPMQSTPRHRRSRNSLALAIVLGVVLVAASGQARPIGTSDPQVAMGVETKIGAEDWEQFPLMMINVAAADVADVAGLVDVVSYYSTFAPYEASGVLSQAEADARSFRLGLQAEPIITAADAAGLHVTITPALLAHPRAFDDNPLPRFIGDGVVQDDVLYVDPAVVPGCVDLTDEACIRVPVHYGQITPAYLDYWAAKLPSFFAAVAAVDPGETVWGIYGSEEIRPWYDLEYAAQRRLRSAIDSDPAMAGRPLLAYSPHNRMPENLAETLIARPNVSGAAGSIPTLTAPARPRTFDPVWSADTCMAVGPGCQVTGFDGYYPLSQDFAVDGAGDLIPMQDHLMRGSYLGLLLGDDGHVNRIASIHRMEAQIETLDNVRNAYVSNGQVMPDHKPFHLPGMNLCSFAEAQPTPAEARHDFWSGVHRGRGIFIYNYQFVVQARNGHFTVACPRELPEPQAVLAVWKEYERGLRLIKSRLRTFLVNGERTYPVQFSEVDAAVTRVVAGTDYLIVHPIRGADATMAMPNYPVLNGSAYRIGTTAFLIVTASYDQHVAFTVPFERRICSVTVAHGDDATLSFHANELSDSMTGIDARVYEVELASDTGCH